MQRVYQLPFLKHGICGMLGCLDCMHVVWGNYPIALQGAFTGKEGMPTLVLEAMSDFHLTIWHALFGFAGALNILIIWENSSLLQDMLNGTMACIVFEFWIGDHLLSKLVCPGGWHISRDCQVCQNNICSKQKHFSAWQEAMHKNVEMCIWCFTAKKSRYFVIHLKNGMRSISMKLSWHVSSCTTWWYKNASTVIMIPSNFLQYVWSR